MSSLIPTKKDGWPAVADGERVMAEDWNRLIDALVAIQIALGTDIDGTKTSLHERLNTSLEWDAGTFAATGAVLEVGYSLPFSRIFSSQPLVIGCVQDLGAHTSPLEDAENDLMGVVFYETTDRSCIVRGYIASDSGSATFGASENANSYTIAWMAIGMT